MRLALSVLVMVGCSAGAHKPEVSKKASPVMQIRFVRSGGFAGAATRVAGTVQFDAHNAHVRGEATDDDYHRDLAPQEADELRTSADPGSLAGAKPAPGPIRDPYQYDITVVTEDGKSSSWTLREGDSSRLASWIHQEAQRIWIHRASTRK